jgi:ammonium transporter, Amt family
MEKSSEEPKLLGPLVVLIAVSILAALCPMGGQVAEGPLLDKADTAWMLTATGLVLLMTPGLSFFYGGMVDRRNIVSTMMQSFIAMGLISIIWIVVGFSLAFGESMGGLIGNPLSYAFFAQVGVNPHPIIATTIPFALFSLFQLKFAIITPALITGAFAERVKFTSYMVFISLFCLFIYCPLAHWTWHPEGFLLKWGVLDFAGGTVVHMAAGFAALATAIHFGPRRKKSSQQETPPVSVPYVLLGTGMLWFGFNAGSALAANSSAALAFMNTNTSSAAAMLAWIFLDMARGKKPTALGACIAAVVGLVAITPAAGFVEVGHSVLIGTVSAIVSNFACELRAKSTLDDTLDVFACHGVGGVMGMLMTGVFATDKGLIYGQYDLFLKECVAMLLVGAYCFCGVLLICKLTSCLMPLRVPESEEKLGLDLSQHGEVMGA